jgi:hypothetical protein
MRRATLIALTVLAGCAQPQPMTFDKPGATQQDYPQDQYECSRNVHEVYVVMNGGIDTAERQIAARQYFLTCMEKRGWTHSAKGDIPIY